jgi:hypothetical protein
VAVCSDVDEVSDVAHVMSMQLVALSGRIRTFSG